MADITEILRLDIDQALRDVSQLEDALDRALTRVELRVDPTAAVRQINDLADEADRALSDVDLIIDPSGIQGVERAADGVAQALNRAEGEARDVDRATRDVERNLTDAEREARQFERALARADDEAREVVTSTNRIAGGFDTIRGKVAGLGAGIVGGVAIAGAIRLASDARTAFADLQDSVNAVKVVFGEASTPVLEFADNVAETAGLSMAQFNQAASILGSSLINVGFGADEAAPKVIELTQRAADMASIFGGEVSTAVDAILSALRGEGNPIERFGVTLTAAKVQAEAAALGFRTVNGELDSTAKTAATLAIIMRETDRTAGDFAATSGDLANAQKIANAEFTNAKASLGEALLPAFQALLDAAPAVLGAIEDLAPALSELALSAGELATSTPGVLDFVDAIHLITDLPRGFGQLGDIATLQLTGIQNSVRAVGTAFTKGPVAGIKAFQDGIRTAFSEFRKNATERGATQGLIDDLREGGDAAQVLADRLADVGRKGKLDQDFVLGLAQIAGTDLQTNVLVFQNLIAEADRLNLAADDVAALNLALAITKDALDGMDVDALHEINRVAREVAADTSFDTITSRFATFTTDLEELPAQMASIAVETRAAAAAVGRSLNPFEEAPEDLGVSAREFFRNLTDEINREAEFQAGVVELIIRGHYDLARMLGEQGPAAQEALSGFLGDDVLAAATEAVLQADTTPTSQAIGDALLQSIQDVPPGPAREALIALMNEGIIDSPQVERGIVDGFASQAGRGISSFRQSLIDEATQMDTTALANAVETAVGGALDFSDFAAAQARTAADATTDSFVEGIAASDVAGRVKAIFDQVNVVVDFFGEGAESRATFLAGLSTAQANEERRLRDSIEGVLNDAIQRRSPPKLFLDAGVDSGNAFWDGFNQADMTLKTALPSVTGKIADGSMPGAAGATEINFNLPNLETRDADVTIARATQLAGSVAGILNGNFKL